MKKIFLFILPFFLFSCGHPQEKSFSDNLDPAAVKYVVNSAIRWQLDHMPADRGYFNPLYNGWADGVFMSAATLWTNVDDSYGFRSELRGIAEKLHYEPCPRTVHPANDLSVCLMYADLYRDHSYPRRVVEEITDIHKQYNDLYKGWKEIIPTIERMDFQMKSCPKTDNLDFEVAVNQERWCWCDALYMAAPAYAAISRLTGDPAYLDFMDQEFWMTADVLYSPSDSLFYRDTRFMSQKEPNGAKVFWGRGNGWVIGALAQIIDLMPSDYPSRDRYIQLYTEMMARLVRLQDKEGYWRTSLLDPEDFPGKEMSSTAFCAYALWWGINRGYLAESEYLDAAERAWTSMVACMQPDGMFGYVQPIGEAPVNITRDKNEVYGTAALALAGAEVIRYISDTPSAKMNRLEEILAYAETRVKAQIADASDAGRLPRTADKDGNYLWANLDWDWTEGFFPGSCWILYETTGNEEYRTAAEKFQDFFKDDQYNETSHDLGFVFNDSYGKGFQLTGNEEFKDVLITSGQNLKKRFNPETGCLQSWNVDDPKTWMSHRGWKFPVIIDNMMNLEMLFELAKITGDNSYYEVAVKHADTTMKNHFRKDYTCYHVVDYDPVTGAVRSRQTAQGYSNESVWSRGQAWAVYGYTVAYRYTGNPIYLEQAGHIADMIMSDPEMPLDKIPYWDMSDPAIPDTYRDVSAAAVIASAFAELSRYSKPAYADYAFEIVNNLFSAKYLVPESAPNHFILDHSVGSIPHGGQIDVPLVYADYYYLEAIKRLMSILDRKPVISQQ